MQRLRQGLQSLKRRQVAGLRILPVLMLFSLVCSVYEIVKSDRAAEARTQMGIWQLILVLIELDIFVTYSQRRYWIKFFQSVFLVTGIILIVLGIYGIILTKKLIDSSMHESRELDDIQLLKMNLYTIMGFLFNLSTALVFCTFGWTSHDEKSEGNEKDRTWTVQVCCSWIQRYVGVSLALSLITISATTIAILTHCIEVNLSMVMIIDVMMIILGISVISNNLKKKFLDPVNIVV